MTGWFICSAALSSYNKVIFGKDRGAFPCPLLLTSVHFLVQWVFSYSVSALFPDYYGGKVVKDMSWKVYLGVSIPCGLVTAVDVGLSNLSLVRISITFFTMVKSSAPVWVLLSAFIFGLEKITWNLIMVGLLITAGEILTAFGEVEFDTVGFLLVLSAAICGGIRWTLVQFKLQKLDPPLGGPVVTMRVLASTMFFSMLLLSFILERPWNALGPEHGDYFIDFEHGMKTISLGLSGAFIAIAMVLCEFWLILNSNAIVLMIGGVVKEMLTIFVGVTFFGDNLNLVNVSGIVVVFLGVFLYKVTYHLSNLEKANLSSDTENNTHFSRLSSNDIFIEENASARLGKRSHVGKNSDPDITLTFKIDDEDIDEEVLMNINGSSPLRERSIHGPPLELGEREEGNPGVI
eukprot:CAMPEP_0172316452 /NCGR_PEP_ID=MMETSP1058-20130122/28265_1 /TAXON_ID=83371 /ORGANISM="Detonula confervacea, Strain CCMP 353" /LENGTH=403 /DNA_ID=CAMNT_0013030761 /DNA_START=188 /DNA_END=1399 /DNA_ORIENTATION=-